MYYLTQIEGNISHEASNLFQIDEESSNVMLLLEYFPSMSMTLNFHFYTNSKSYLIDKFKLLGMKKERERKYLEN